MTTKSEFAELARMMERGRYRDDKDNEVHPSMDSRTREWELCIEALKIAAGS